MKEQGSKGEKGQAEWAFSPALRRKCTFGGPKFEFACLLHASSFNLIFRMRALSSLILLTSLSVSVLAAEGGSSAPLLKIPDAFAGMKQDAEPQATVTPASGEAREVSPAQRQLQGLILRQQKLFGEAAKRVDDPNYDQDTLRQKVQELVFDYEGYLRDYPDVAAGYASYGMLLSKMDMRRQAMNMFLKANKLDADLPLVKNQIGNYLAEEGRVIEAANYFTAAIRLSPEEPLYHYQLGMLLTEGAEDFVKSGQWTADAVNKMMFEAFKKAAELAPNRIEFSYRFCEAYYDLASPLWDEALEAWANLESRVGSDLERETCRLHRANILLKQERIVEARKLLASISASELSSQKEKLIAQLPENKKP